MKEHSSGFQMVLISCYKSHYWPRYKRNKKTHKCLDMGAYFRVWAPYSPLESPSKMLSNDTSFMLFDPVLTELLAKQKNTQMPLSKFEF